MNKTIIIFGVLCMAACALPVTSITVMKNPKTGQVARCGGASATIIGIERQRASDIDCVVDYERQGFEIVSEKR